MLLKGDQLAQHLSRELRPLYVLYGDEPLLVLEAADTIRARAGSADMAQAVSEFLSGHEPDLLRIAGTLGVKVARVLREA